MSVLILNVTGNINGVEDQFCQNIIRGIPYNVDLVNRGGPELTEGEPVLNNHFYKVVVIVGHACALPGSNTFIDIGFDDPSLIPQAQIAINSPTTFVQTLGNNMEDYILIYCSCNALSVETLDSGITDPHCIGVIASIDPVNTNTDVNLVTEIINSVYLSVLNNQTSLNHLHRLIVNIVNNHGGRPLFRYLETSRVEIE